MRLEDIKKVVDAGKETIINDTLVLEGLDLVFALGTLLVNLVLLCSNEGLLIYIWVNLNV